MLSNSSCGRNCWNVVFQSLFSMDEMNSSHLSWSSHCCTKLSCNWNSNGLSNNFWRKSLDLRRALLHHHILLHHLGLSKSWLHGWTHLFLSVFIGLFTNLSK